MSTGSMLDRKAMEAGSNVRSRTYWQDRLAGLELQGYFSGQANTAVSRTAVGCLEWHTPAPEGLWQRLEAAAPGAKTKQAALLSVLGVLVYLYGGCEDVVVFTHPGPLPIRMRNFSGCWLDLLNTLKHDFRRDLEHGTYPLERLLSKKKEELKYTPCIALSTDREEEEGLLQQLLPEVHFAFNNEPASLTVRYDPSRVDEIQTRDLGTLFWQLLEKLLLQPRQLLSAIPLITAAGQDEILYRFNPAAKAFPAEKTIIGLFIEQALRTPGHTAIQFREEQVTYADLDRRSDRVARLLEDKGVGPGQVVGVLMDRSIEMMTALYGILKAGAVYLPVSRHYPANRTLYMLQNSSCALLFTDADLADPYRESFVTVGIDELRLAIKGGEASHMAETGINRALPMQPAYIIYTSGSTGQPKGVLIRHDSIVNRLVWMQDKYLLTPDDVLLQKTPLVFDVSIWELFWWAITGAKLVLAEPGVEARPDLVSETIDHAGITVLHFVPSMLHALIDYWITGRSRHRLTSIKHLFASGEELTTADALSFLQACPQARIHNLYGPTEATVDVSFFEVLPSFCGKKVPIGQPIDNTQLLIFGRHGHLQPIGAPGELYIGGVNLAMGYINQPRLTRSRFVSHPLDPRQLLYATGDLARWLPDGQIEFLGRIDHQVKIRGNRVETGEIEQVLMSFEGVSHAVVLVRSSVSGKHLAAYIAGENWTSEELRQYTASKLPDYMIPSFFIRLAAIPLTVNGKVDRAMLLSIEPENEDLYIEPVTEMEIWLSGCWQEILRRDKVGAGDRFFRIGGDSILAVRLLGAINQSWMGGALSMTDLLSQDTLGDLAAFIDEQRRGGVLLEERAAADRSMAEFEAEYRLAHPWWKIAAVYPMSDIEKGMCFGALRQLEHSIYFEQNVVPLPYRQFTQSRLEQAMQLMVSKHAALRTGYDLDVLAHIEFEEMPVLIGWYDLAGLGQAEQRAVVLHDMDESRRQPFSLLQPPLWRMTVYRLSDNHHVMVFELHHAIMDGWSYSSFLTELNNIYVRLADQPSFDPGRLACSYRDAVLQELLQKNNGQSTRFWQDELSEYKRLDLGLSASTAEYKTLEKDYPASLLADLKTAAQQMDTTVKGLLFAAYLYAFKLLTGTNDLVVGLVSFMRPAKEDGDKVLGCFLNTIPVRIKIPAGITWEEYARLVKKQMDIVSRHDHLSLFEISRSIGETIQEANPIFDTLFNFVNFHVFNDLQQQQQKEIAEPVPRIANFLRGNTLFDVVMEETAAGINAKYHYVTNFIGESKFMQWTAFFEAALVRLIDSRRERMDSRQVLDPAEVRRLLVEFNDTEKRLPGSETLITRWERRVDQMPDKIAVVYRDKTLTYAELNSKANQVARRLRTEQGVLPNDLVGIMANRSENMMVGLLGILKAGAAYLPVDPAYPAERTAYLLEDSGIRLLLADDDLKDRGGSDAVVLSLSQWASDCSGMRENLPLVNRPEDVCYMIYTSGSTGKPKGVRISHDNVINFFAGMDERIPVQEDDCLLALTSTSFDISVLELFWTLCSGVEVLIQPSGLALDHMDHHLEQETKTVDFSLFFFSSYNNRQREGKYSLLLEAARYADRQGFKAIWTPERHFHEFGGLYPNPALTSAALAMITENIQLRSGSLVSPLHDVLRIAEEWSVVDNLSNGRMALSFASGWNPNDFVFEGADYERRQSVMFGQIETIRRLWRGESLARINGKGEPVDVRVYPLPVQKELPVWVTAAGSEETFVSAGAIGADLLTHLLGQDLEGLEKKIGLYRKARIKSGHTGPGHVALMLHAYIGENLSEAEREAEAPFVEYLKSSLGLTKSLYAGAGFSGSDISEEDKNRVLREAFRQMYRTNTLIGTEETASIMILRLREIGVDEIACLVDFGIAEPTVISGLERLKKLKELFAGKRNKPHRPVTLMQCTPSLAKLMVESDRSKAFFNSLRQIMLGGEALPMALLRQIRQETKAELYNMYGPTETTIWSAVYPFSGTDERISIGRPIANTQIYILDEQLQLLPLGVPGFLYIGGRGLSSGYWNRAELTAEKFIVNPFQPGDRIYNTGDIARWLPDGNIEYIGRQDQQVKIRGYRIELGEIESRLADHEQVIAAAVIVREELGGKQLIAYYEAETELDAGMLRAYLMARLPVYMLPALFVYLRRLPLTPNGKIDRKALPAPGQQPLSGYIAPTGELEQLLAGTWSEILKTDIAAISAMANFFELGGNSIQAIRLITRLNKVLGITVDWAEVFKYPTLRGMAAVVSQLIPLQQTPSAARIIPLAEKREYYPISYAQRRIVYSQRLFKSGASYNATIAFKMEGKVDMNRLRNAFQTLVQRHEVFRTSYLFPDGSAVQQIHPSADMDIDYKELGPFSDGEDWEAAVSGEIKQFIRPFDLSRPPLLRAAVLSVSDELFLLIVDIDHSITDGSSHQIMMAEFLRLLQGQELPDCRLQYKDFAVAQNSWYRTAGFAASQAYWRKQFASIPEPIRLPADQIRDGNINYEGREYAFSIDGSFAEKILSTARRMNATPFTFLLTAFKHLLYKLTGQEDICVGIPYAQRDAVGADRLLGSLLNTLVLRSYPGKGKTFAAFLEEVRQASAGAYAHADYPFEMLLEDIGYRRQEGRNPLFDVLFNSQNFDAVSETGEQPGPGWKFSPYQTDLDSTALDLSLFVQTSATAIRVNVHYRTGLFGLSTIRYFMDQYRILLELIVDDPDRPMDSYAVFHMPRKRKNTIQISTIKS